MKIWSRLLTVWFLFTTVLFSQDAAAPIPDGFINAYNDLNDTQFSQYVRAHAAELRPEMLYSLISEGVVSNKRVYFAFTWAIVKELDNGALRGMAAYFYGRHLATAAEYEAALAFLARSVAEYTELAYPEGVGSAYDGIGDVMLAKGEPGKARIAYAAGLAQLPAGAAHATEIELQLGIAAACFRLNNGSACAAALDVAGRLLTMEGMQKYTGDYNYLAGMYYSYAGNQAKAGICFRAAEQYYGTVQDTAALVNVWQGVGEIALQLGADSTAAVHFNRVLAASVGQPLIKLQAVKGLGIIEMQKENFSAARNAFKDGLAAALELKDKLACGNFLRRLADLEAMQGNYLLADSLYRASLVQFKLGNVPVGQSNILLSLAELSIRKNDWQTAEKFAAEALVLFNSAGITESVAFAEFWLAKVKQKTAPAEALPLYRAALKRLSAAYALSGDGDEKLFYGAKLSTYYRQAAAVLLSLGTLNEGLSAVEGMRSRALLEQLSATVALNSLPGLPPIYKQSVDSINGKIAELALSLRGAAAGIVQDSLITLTRRLKDTLLLLQEQISAKYPIYASLRFPSSPTVEQVTAKLNTSEAIVEYLVADSAVWVLVFKKAGVTVKKLSASPAVITFKVSSYLKTLKNVANTFPDASLYGILIPEEELKGIKRLVVIPDASLYGLPFEALWNGRKYLLESFTINYYQSVAIWLLARTTAPANATVGFAGFGDPVYDYDSYAKSNSERGVLPKFAATVSAGITRELLLRSFGTLERLPGTAAEVKSAGGTFGAKGIRAKIYLRENASEENIKAAAAENYAYYLLSCHGILADGFQGLVISQLPEGKEDGLLTVQEILQLQWNPRLLVLSACQTGRGEIIKGEGICGITRAAMYSGANAVCASLWSVSDAGTSELMQAFFKNIAAGNRHPADALSDAKLALLKSQSFSHPYFWSPFVLYGE